MQLASIVRKMRGLDINSWSILELTQYFAFHRNAYSTQAKDIGDSIAVLLGIEPVLRRKMPTSKIELSRFFLAVRPKYYDIYKCSTSGVNSLDTADARSWSVRRGS